MKSIRVGEHGCLSSFEGTLVPSSGVSYIFVFVQCVHCGFSGMSGE